MFRIPFSSDKIKVPTVDYFLIVRDEPVLIANLIGKERELLELHMRTEGPLSGGYVISADGKVVFDVIDQVSMSASWLPALTKILQGSLSEQVWAWEESNMVLKRTGETLQIEDAHHSGRVLFPRTVFNVYEFAATMITTSLPVAAFLTGYQNEMEQRRLNAAKDTALVERINDLMDGETLNWDGMIEECRSALAQSQNTNS